MMFRCCSMGATRCYVTVGLMWVGGRVVYAVLLPSYILFCLLLTVLPVLDHGSGFLFCTNRFSLPPTCAATPARYWITPVLLPAFPLDSAHSSGADSGSAWFTQLPLHCTVYSLHLCSNMGGLPFPLFCRW